jgi:hypothetical protein
MRRAGSPVHGGAELSKALPPAILFCKESCSRMNVDLFETLNAGKPIRVLLVDDDEASYMLTRHHLSKISGGKLLLDWAPSYERD